MRKHFLFITALIAPLLPMAALAAEHIVVIDKMQFGALPAQLQVGDTIVWRNEDIFRHTATARDQSFDLNLPPRTEATMTIETAGEIPFFCRFHPGMRGTLDVTP